MLKKHRKNDHLFPGALHSIFQIATLVFQPLIVLIYTVIIIFTHRSPSLKHSQTNSVSSW